jgi:chemotaxis protein MotB
MSGEKHDDHGAKGGHGGGHGKKGGHHDEEHEEHVNHEAWVIPYADLLTLLLAMFLALWATSKADAQKMNELANAFRAESGGQVVIQGGTGLQDAGGDDPKSIIDLGLNAARAVRAEQALKAAEAAQAAKAAENAQLQSVEEQLKAEAQQLGIADKLSFRREERGLVVTIVSDQVLFQSGDAALMPNGVSILDALIGPVIKIDKPISIEGHTDDRPVSGKFASNWELSTARATNVLRYLVSRHGFPASMISASGYADTKPVKSNATAEGQAANRRVEIVVLSTAATDVTPPGVSTPPTTQAP